MSGSVQERDDLECMYRERREAVLVRLADDLGKHLADLLKDEPLLKDETNIDRVAARAKSVKSFLEKARAKVEGRPKYDEPLAQIQDQVAARIVVLYLSHVKSIEALVRKNFSAIENRTLVPESESEFGYFGHHMVLAIPSDFFPDELSSTMAPAFFELQIKTLFQHAWSEADHDLGYKPGDKGLTSDQKRRIALASAQAWGADLIFDALAQERLSETAPKTTIPVS